MVKHRYLISFFSTTLFYLLLAGTYFYVQTQYLISDQKPQDKIIHLSLATCVPEVVPPVEEPEEIEKEEPVVEEETIEEPEPVVEEKPVPEKIIPEPIEPKIIPKSKPIVEKIEKKLLVTKKTVKKKKVKKKVRKKAPAKTTKGLKQTGTAQKNDSAKKSQFLAKVRRKINQHKSYPKIAKRRGMQGVVKVRFTILASGNVGHISVRGPKVFHNSARYAVKSAFPISTKNIPLSLPESVNLTLRYQLR